MRQNEYDRNKFKKSHLMGINTMVRVYHARWEYARCESPMKKIGGKKSSCLVRRIVVSSLLSLNRELHGENESSLVKTENCTVSFSWDAISSLSGRRCISVLPNKNIVMIFLRYCSIQNTILNHPAFMRIEYHVWERINYVTNNIISIMTHFHLPRTLSQSRRNP